MDFRFTKEEEEWRREIRDFMDTETSPESLERLIQEQGCTNPHSPELYAKLAAKGYLGLTWPKEYGGQGRSPWYQYILTEEISRSYVPWGTLDCMSISVVYTGGSILTFGNEEQKQNWLPKIAQGELTCAIGITEPNVGCDTASAELTAEESNNYYVLNGTKIFNCAHLTNHILVLARTDPKASEKHRGLSIFIVPLSSPGITVSPNFMTIGRMKRSEVAFEDIRVSANKMLGEKNRGFYYLMQAMLFERAQRIGPSELEREFESLVEYVKDTKSKFQGQILCKIPSVRYALAEIATEIEISRLLGRRVCWLGEKGKATLGDTSISLVYLTEMMERAANKCLDILGQAGLLENRGQWMSLYNRLVTLWRDSRARKIASGTSEIQRNIIATVSLGLPRR